MSQEILWTGAALYARYRFLLISNKLCEWTVAELEGGGRVPHPMCQVNGGVQWQCGRKIFLGNKNFLTALPTHPPINFTHSERALYTARPRTALSAQLGLTPTVIPNPQLSPHPVRSPRPPPSPSYWAPPQSTQSGNGRYLALIPSWG